MSEFLDLNNYEFSKRALIGQGAFGEVYKVIDKNSREVFAAKISLTKLTKDQKSLITNLKREVNIISQLNHPSILKFIGYSPVDFKNNNYPVIITEFSSNGSLNDIIELERQSLSPQMWNDTKKLINIYGIASAMSYLHKHEIIHRDLKPANILEDDYLFPKIADFGLSKMMHSNIESMTTQSTVGFKGTPIYIPPESWESNEYTKNGDVYAFSIIVYELMTLEKPFDGYNFTMLLTKVVIKGERPEFRYPIADCYRELITKCWSADPNDRPTFEQIVNELKTNEDFITDCVDKDEFYDYIDMIENSGNSFDPSKKFKKILISNSVSNKKVLEKEKPQSLFNSLKTLTEFNKIPKESQTFLKQILGKQPIDKKTISIPSDKTVMLYLNNSLKSKDFISLLNSFDSIMFDIECPIDNFEDLFTTLAKLKEELKEKIIFNLISSDLSQFKEFFNSKSITFSVIIPSSCTTISQNGFSNSIFLEKITIPSSVTSIKSYSFEKCSSLTEIIIPSSITSINDYTFTSCKSLTNVMIPSSVTYIGIKAFSECEKLTKISIPSSVTKIESCAFKFCYSLRKITIHSSEIELKNAVFDDCKSLEKIIFYSDIILSDTVDYKPFAQLNNKNTVIEFKGNLTEIESRLFENCTTLKQMVIPPSVKIINEWAFNNCSGLIQITIPSGLTDIRSNAFENCSSLLKISIPSSVTTIGSSAFESCQSLTKIKIPSSVTKIENRTFYN